MKQFNSADDFTSLEQVNLALSMLLFLSTVNANQTTAD